MSPVKHESQSLPQTLSASGIFEPIKPHMAALDAFLEKQVLEFSPVTREMVRYTFTHRGKRLRPALVFFSGWNGEEPSEDLVRGAAIVELIHLATLVHDDILDDARLRHASPTLFAKYGSHTAVLLGDAILAHALKLMADFESIEFCRATAAATRKVCDGEIWQTAERGNAAISLDAYFKIIQMKTGELFEISAYLGAMLGGHGAEKGAACAKFGGALGRAYQIFDDLVDLAGSEKSAGKTLGTDLASGKFTLPVILFLQKLDATERAKTVAEISSGTLGATELATRIRERKIPEETLEYFARELETARAAIAPYAENPGTRRMLELADFVAAQTEKVFSARPQ